MSHENVRSVRRFMERAREDPEGVWDIFGRDVLWEVGALAIPDVPATFRGPDGVREFFRRWVGAFEDWAYEVEEVIDAGDAVAVHLHQWGRGKGSGATVDLRFWEVWIMRGGKAVRVTHRLEKADALEAAGLSD
jgi:ketosteroid isomerase-like protein